MPSGSTRAAATPALASPRPSLPSRCVTRSATRSTELTGTIRQTRKSSPRPDRATSARHCSPCVPLIVARAMPSRHAVRVASASASSEAGSTDKRGGALATPNHASCAALAQVSRPARSVTAMAMSGLSMAATVTDQSGSANSGSGAGLRRVEIIQAKAANTAMAATNTTVRTVSPDTTQTSAALRAKARAITIASGQRPFRSANGFMRRYPARYCRKVSLRSCGDASASGAQRACGRSSSARTAMPARNR